MLTGRRRARVFVAVGVCAEVIRIEEKDRVAFVVECQIVNFHFTDSKPYGGRKNPNSRHCSQIAV